MKLINIKYIIVVFFVTILSVSCTDEFEQMNTDPNKFLSPKPSLVFNGAVRETYLHLGGYLNNEAFLTYAGYIGQRGGSLGNFSYEDARVNTMYQRCYTDVIVTLQTFIDDYKDDPKFSNRVEMAKIWNTYIYSVLVATFGPIHYSDAIGTELVVAYDSEKEVYTELLETLKQASINLNVAGDKFVVDPVYNGNISQWIKFCNSLRLKLALRISGSSDMSELADSHLSDVMLKEQEMLETNVDNVVLIGEASNVLNWSYAYDKFIFNTGVTISQIPMANFHFLLNLRTFSDPRLEAYHDVAKDSLTIEDVLLKSGSATETINVSYKIPYYGKTISGTSTLGEWGLDSSDNPYQGLADDVYSRPNFEKFFAEDAQFDVITAAETYFMKAEAKLLGYSGSESVESYYYKGIETSFEHYGLSSDVAAYKEIDGVKWGTSNPGIRDIFNVIDSSISADPLDQIVRQRWFAMFYQGLDGWCLNRRTRLIPTQPHYNPDNTQTARTTVYAEVPERLVFPPSEKGTNTSNYEEAVALLGGIDDLITPLKINTFYERIPSPETILDAEYNYDFASGWYGDSEDDLIAKGINYDIIILE